MNYCSDCGATVSLKIPENDERMRFVCDTCGMIHYQNPKIVAGVLSVRGEQVLLCRRAIAPRYGLWTLPAGFMENGETTDQAAAREAHEEANATLRDLRLYTVISVPHVSHVHVIYRCELVSDDFAPGWKVWKRACSMSMRFRGMSWHSTRCARRWNAFFMTASKGCFQCTIWRLL